MQEPWPGLLITVYPPSGKEVREIKVTEQKVKRMNLNVPIELHNSFKAATASRGEAMTDVLLKFIESYVAKRESAPAGKGRRK